MTEKELTTTLFFQAVAHYLMGEKEFAEEVLLSAMNNHFTGAPFPTVKSLLM